MRGLRWIDQRLPFQRSASEPSRPAPTPVQAAAALHEPPSRRKLPMFGVRCILHFLPSHRSMNEPGPARGSRPAQNSRQLRLHAPLRLAATLDFPYCPPA
jgi:hypothetical protein